MMTILILGRFTNHVDDEDNDEEQVISEKSGKGRGKDIEWIEIARFKDKAEYENSHYFLDIKKYFTMRKGRENWYSDNEHYTCKFARKRSHVKCPLQYKVHFLTTSDEVVLESNTRSHIHKEITEYDTAGPNRHWTIGQTEIVMNSLRNEASAKMVERNLRDANVFTENNFPTSVQLNTKIQHCRSLIRKTLQIFDTHQLREKIEEKLEVPANDTDSYIVYHHVDDEQEKEEPHFSIIWTSKKLTARISDDFIQDDATYRLTWQGYPFFVSGRSTPTGKFFATHVSLSSHEDTRAWKSSYKFVEKIATPKYRMGDGAQEITNAGEEVFGDEGTRLMCWPHTYRNLLKRMAALRNSNPKLQQQLMNDIQNLQWSCHSEKSFLVVFDLLENKYVHGDFISQEKLLLANFFEYFRGQWGPGSHVFRFVI